MARTRIQLLGPQQAYGRIILSRIDNHWAVYRSIQRLRDTPYRNHIERLMNLENFMLLCEIAPSEVYRWFMEMFIDAYDGSWCLTFTASSSTPTAVESRQAIPRLI